MPSSRAYWELQSQAKVRCHERVEKVIREANGIIQATIIKKCDRTYHRPQTNKACAAGTCQHTCESAQVPECPHKWTVRYSVNSRQREASFATLTEAQVFRAELSTKKVTQGALFTDPRAGARKFGDIRKEYAARLDISTDTLEVYERNYRGSGAAEMLDGLPVATVARMESDVDTLVNTTHLKKSRVYRRQQMCGLNQAVVTMRANCAG